jgi:secreted trypsin-like serine protease
VDRYLNVKMIFYALSDYYLDEVIVPVVSFEDCNDSNSYSGKVTDETMICAGLTSGGKDTCNGDGSGPLLVAGNSAGKDI